MLPVYLVESLNRRLNMALIKQLLRGLGVTVLAALAGAVIITPSLLISSPVDVKFFSALPILFLLYLICLLLLGWPTFSVLRFLGQLTLMNGAIAGAILVGLGNLLVSRVMTEIWEEQVFWAGIGMVSGAVAGWILRKWGVSDDLHRAQALDKRSGYANERISYTAFFSYSRADDVIANWLWKTLDKYRTPSGLSDPQGKPLGQKKLHPIFRDRFDLSAGGKVSERLGDALSRSRHLVVLCTPSAASSLWVEHEVTTFMEQGKAHMILPVIGAGIPNSGNPKTECFPPSLRNQNLLAADLREGNAGASSDGRRLGALKLIAALLGVEFDRLVGRENVRARRRAALFAGATALMSAAALLAVFMAFTAIGAFRWSSDNLRSVLENELQYMVSLYRIEGAEQLTAFINTRQTLRSATPVCRFLLDEKDGIIAGETPGTLKAIQKIPGISPDEAAKDNARITVEVPGQYYDSSPFNVQLDGYVSRVSPVHRVGTVSCDQRRPFFYGVYRRFVGD